MMVTFVSQCEKNALNRTRRVLDTFANRIGDSTWQTVITQEGLSAVKKMLRKTASKNTAVSCHWVRSRAHSELIWIVGKRNKFNYEGIVPVNTTVKNIANNHWENNWHYLPLIRVVTALAALFHDWGKATVCFQKKLEKRKHISDPLRHEWISCLLFHAFVHCRKVGNSEVSEDDTEWLNRLSAGVFDETGLKNILREEQTKKPLDNLPPLATMVSWLILTHHLLPFPEEDTRESYAKCPLSDYKKLFGDLKASYGYKNLSSVNKNDCLTFKKGLLSNCPAWIKEVKKWSGKASKQLVLLKKLDDDRDVWRPVLFYARLSLMLGDHNYSSKPACKKWKKNASVDLFANTKNNEKDQRLDEHLVNVSKEAQNVVNCLPRLEKSFHSAEDIGILEKGSPKGFEWQGKAASAISEWRRNNKLEEEQQFGFFAVNMASTGKGKTFANAKIMRALSEKGNNLRYILALGLRTLTLQTGDEYKERLKIGDDLAVLIGSQAVKELHDEATTRDEENLDEAEGSESREVLLKEELFENPGWKSDIPEERLKTVLRRDKDRCLLYAPVLVCTIDHIMGATETVRGGRYILPSLRLMSSDLVIDEVDDFNVDDLKAIGRLVHLAGMLGCKVMISSATIPPDLAKGFFRAYHKGWSTFAKSRGINSDVGCAWIDEFKTSVDFSFKNANNRSFSDLHDRSVEYRIKKLQKEEIKRKAVLVKLDAFDEGHGDGTLETQYFSSIQDSIVNMHERHCILDEINKKRVSFGVVRMANINPCIKLTKHLLEREWPNDVEIKAMAYHSQQILLMRSEQEKHLDKVLKRHKVQEAFKNPVIREQLSQANTENVIYILVATPVEEVGRDHDFDWAVVEPSSYRSIIQLAGRVLRHRNESPSAPNIALMRYNLEGYKQKHSSCKKRKAVFFRPGYKCGNTLFESHDLKELVDEESLQHSVDAVPRIKYGRILNPRKSLVDLEHHVIKQALNTPKFQGAGDLEGWLSQYWWLTGIPQRLYRFRKGLRSKNIYLVPQDEEGSSYKFMEKNDQGYWNSIELTKGIEFKEEWQDSKNRLWLKRDYHRLLIDITKEKETTIENAAKRYGELSLMRYGDDGEYIYSPQFGLIRY